MSPVTISVPDFKILDIADVLVFGIFNPEALRVRHGPPKWTFLPCLYLLRALRQKDCAVYFQNWNNQAKFLTEEFTISPWAGENWITSYPGHKHLGISEFSIKETSVKKDVADLFQQLGPWMRLVV